MLKENSVTSDQVRASSLEDEKDNEINDSSITINKQSECDRLTYAKVIAFKPALNSTNENVLKPQQKNNPGMTIVRLVLMVLLE